MLVYLIDGSDQTIVRATTLRHKLQIKLAISSSHSTNDYGWSSPSADPVTPGAWQDSHWYNTTGEGGNNTTRESRCNTTGESGFRSSDLLSRQSIEKPSSSTQQLTPAAELIVTIKLNAWRVFSVSLTSLLSYDHTGVKRRKVISLFTLVCRHTHASRGTQLPTGLGWMGDSCYLSLLLTLIWYVQRIYNCKYLDLFAVFLCF